jgi:lipoprotein NlpD
MKPNKMRMTKKSTLLLLSVSLAVLSGCTSTTLAPVIERDLTPPPPAVVKPAPVVEEVKDKEGSYTVRKGDTLIRIALEYGLNYRDLAAWNNLANADDIKVDQVLRTTQPEGVQTAAVLPPPAIERTPPPPKKTTPKGDKRPYTEGNLAEMQKPEGSEPSRVADKPIQLASINPNPAASVPSVLTAEDRELSWMWPSDGKVVALFDEGKNKGIDIAGRAGQQVLAAGAGKVMYAGSGIRGYGNLVIVKHSNSLLSAYAHNRAILVKEGDTVRRGQTIAEMGDSDTDTVKLHFEIRQQGKPVDPSKFLPNR